MEKKNVPSTMDLKQEQLHENNRSSEEMMIPSEMPSVTMGENGHGNGHFKIEPAHAFQQAEQMMRSQLRSQMQAMGPDQMQVLQSLQHMAGKKQKEEQNKMLADSAEGARREVPQLMQELQLNILQQSQLLQAGETAKSSGQLHQLQTKQQQLVAQLQFAQHAITLAMLASKQEDERKRRRRRRCQKTSLREDLLLKPINSLLKSREGQQTKRTKALRSNI